MKSLIKRIFMCALVATTLVGCSSSTSESKVVEATPTPSATPITETVELTIDNWQDYFEVKEVTIPDYDAFDEATGWSEYIMLSLKDGMTFAENSNPEVAVEYEFDANYKEVANINLENLEIEYGDSVYPYEESPVHKSNTTTMHTYYGENEEELSQNYLNGYIEILKVDTYDDELCAYGADDWNYEEKYILLLDIDTFIISRIKGTIEIVKEN